MGLLGLELRGGRVGLERRDRLVLLLLLLRLLLLLLSSLRSRGPGHHGVFVPQSVGHGPLVTLVVGVFLEIRVDEFRRGVFLDICRARRCQGVIKAVSMLDVRLCVGRARREREEEVKREREG